MLLTELDMSMEAIANILFEWGPAGAVTLLIIVAEKKLRERWDGSRGRDRKISSLLYVGNWIFIAILLMVVSTIWVLDRGKANIALSGIIQDMRPNYRVTGSTDDLFIRMKYKNQFLRDAHWRYFNSKVPDSIEIRLENIAAYDFNDYKVPLGEIKDVQNIHILFKGNKLFLKEDGTLIALESVHSATDELKEIPEEKFNSFNFSFIGVAYANDEIIDKDLVFEALESDDSYLRQYASLYLLDNLSALIPEIEQKLLSNKSSEIMRIGLTTVLAKASSIQFSDRNWQLSEEASERIFLSVFSENEVLATQARRFVIRNMNDKFIHLLESNCDYESNTQSDKEYCSFMGLNLYYNYAIQMWRESKITSSEVTMQNIKLGLRVLEQGLYLREYLSREKSIQFGKLLYGQAFLYHELSKLQRNPDMNKSIIAAKAYFEKFLEYLKRDHLGEYEYQHHRLQALCYVTDPGQECFDDNPPL